VRGHRRERSKSKKRILPKTKISGANSIIQMKMPFFENWRPPRDKNNALFSISISDVFSYASLCYLQYVSTVHYECTSRNLVFDKWYIESVPNCAFILSLNFLRARSFTKALKCVHSVPSWKVSEIQLWKWLNVSFVFL